MTNRAKWIVAVALAIIAGLAIATVVQLRPLVETAHGFQTEGGAHVL